MSADASRAARRELRRRLRSERRALDPVEAKVAGQKIIHGIGSLGAYRRARRVAVYAAFDGEPSLDTLIHSAQSSGKQVFVPILRGRAMQFARLEPGAALTRNFFGLLEPARPRIIDPRRLDLVLTPLVACDRHGTRVGVGRGYYDRAFAFLTRREHWYRPKLVGIAFELQLVEHIERQSWDVPLWALVTEKKVRRFAASGDAP